MAVVVLAGVLAFAGIAQPAARWWAASQVSRAAQGSSQCSLRTPVLAAASSLCVCGWLVAGAAAWVFVVSLTAGPTPLSLFLLAAYTFAWLVGFVVPFAPSGLGVREATLIALLAPELGVAPATALTVGLRLANVAGDFLAIGAVEAARLAATAVAAVEPREARRLGDAVNLALVGVLFLGLCVGVEVLARRVSSLARARAKARPHVSAVFAAFLPLVLSFAEIAALGLVFALRDGDVGAPADLQRDPRRVPHDVRRGVLPARHRGARDPVPERSCPSPTASSSSGSATGSRRSWAGGSGGRVVPLLQTSKTLWGSGTFLVVCFALGTLLLGAAGVPPAYALAAAAAMAIVLTPVELYLTHGLDNLVLPALAGSLVAAL